MKGMWVILPLLGFLLYGVLLILWRPPLHDETPLPFNQWSLSICHQDAAHKHLFITKQTLVWLDNKPCEFTDVPEDSSVTDVEVSSDGETILKIHFRRKGSK